MQQQKNSLSQKTKILIKGNGSTYCLLTQKDIDQQQFIQRQLSFKLKQIYFSGYFTLALDQELFPWIWGTLDTKILMKQAKLSIESQKKMKINQISCGWEHAILLSDKIYDCKQQKSSKVKIYGIGSNKYGQLFPSYLKLNEQLSKTKYFYEIIELNHEFLINQNQIVQDKIKVLGGFRQSYLLKDNVLYGKGESKNYELGFNSKQFKYQNIKQSQGWIKIKNLKHFNIQENHFSDIIKMRAGKKFTIFLNRNGKSYGLGTNQFNVFNLKPNQNNQIPKILPEIQQLSFFEQNQKQIKIVNIQCGWTHLIIQSQVNKIYTYGRNNFGQLGKDKNQLNHTKQLKFPIQCQKQNIEIKSGTQFSFALINKKVYGWGWNQHHNIIHSNQHVISEPRQIEILQFKNEKQKQVQKIWTNPAITAIKFKNI